MIKVYKEGSFAVERISAKDKIRFLWLVSILYCTYPYVFNLFLPLPPIFFLILLTFVATLLVYGNKLSEIFSINAITTVVLLQFLGSTIGLLAVQDSEYVKQMFYILWILCFLGLCRAYGIKKFLLIYNRIILIVALFGVLAFFLSLFLGYHAWFEYINMDGRPGAFVWCTFCNNHAGNFIRYCGIFDEPGAMAYWGMFSLITNKLYVKDRKIEIPLIVSLLFTFSLAYYIQIVIYFVAFYLKNLSIKQKLLSLFVVLVAVVAFVHYSDEDSQLYRATLYRMGMGSDAIDVATENNRARMMDEAVKIFKQNPVFGIGPTQFYGGTYAADNPYETLAKDGIVGTFFIYLPLIITFCYGVKKKEVLMASVVLFIGYLQRPFHINFIHYTMLYMFFYIAYQLAHTKQIINRHV